MFDSIKNMIQKMIFHLMDEQKNEDEHKHWSETETEIASRTEDRAADKAENSATIKDAEDAQEAIAQAIAVLKTFYKESGEVAKEAWEAFAQTKAVARRQGVEPEPELWEEEKYTGTEGGAAVIGMLENCATDFAKMESQARADETAHQDEFDTFLTSAQMDKASRTKDTEMKSARKGRFEDKKSAKVESQDHTTKELEGTQQYRKDLEHACEDGDSSYADRKDARASEITALREAQGILDKAFEEA